MQRHRKLHQQWGSYIDCQYELREALHDLARIAGIMFDDEYYILSSDEACEKAFNTCVTCSPAFDKNAIRNNLLRIKRAIDSLLDESLHIGFIDWNYSEAKSFRYKYLCEVMDDVERRSDTSLSKDDVRSLANQMVYFLAAARRPWRYRNDMDHNKLLERFLEEHGEPI